MSKFMHSMYGMTALGVAAIFVVGNLITEDKRNQHEIEMASIRRDLVALSNPQNSVQPQPLELYPQVQTQQNVAQPVLQAAQQQFAPPPIAQPVQQQFAPQPVAAPANLGDDPQVVASLTNVLSRAHYIEGKTKPKDGRWTYILFDPNCPYCHAAYEELDGKIAIRWLPVPLLGDTPIETATTLLAKPDSKTLDDAFTKKLVNDPAANNAQMQTKAYENLQLMQSFVSSGQAQGVPVILAPRANGTAHYQSGYNAGESAQILTAIGG